MPRREFITFRLEMPAKLLALADEVIE